MQLSQAMYIAENFVLIKRAWNSV